MGFFWAPIAVELFGRPSDSGYLLRGQIQLKIHLLLSYTEARRGRSDYLRNHGAAVPDVIGVLNGAETFPPFINRTATVANPILKLEQGLADV
jgi:hypothetical protein